MQFTPMCLMLTCLQVTPDRAQFFRYDSIALSCSDPLNSTGWRVKRETEGGGVKACSRGWGSASLGSTCIISIAYPPDSGLYWCESAGGERSNSVNITVTDHPVLLESPAHPVPAGAAVTLRCRAKTESPQRVFSFYKDGLSVGSSAAGELNISSVSKSDQGLYACRASGGEESAGSWLAVQEHDNAPPSVSPPACCSLSPSRIICHLVVGVPYLLSTVLLGLIHRDRYRAVHAVPQRTRSCEVIMEVAV